jgi:hypothetical protein
MPPTEIPPNPAPTAPEQTPASEAIKIATRRYGELDHTELVHLLDSLEGDQAKSRFRESVYISIIVYLALALLLVYGPKYIFHTGTIVPTAASLKEKQQLMDLEMNRELAKTPPKPPKVLPKVDRKVIEQLQAMQRASEAAKAAQAPPPPAPAPPTPAPAPAAPPPPPAVAQNNLPSAPMPQPAPRPSTIPDSPMPQAPAPQSPGQSIAEAGRASGLPRMSGRMTEGTGAHVGKQGAGTGVEIISDTRGVDFTDYIKRILRMIKAGWLPLIPEECYPPLSKEGSTLIHFTIAKNGQLTDPMKLEDSTHDRAIDKAAWGAITGVGQFPPLPSAYTGPTLELRIQFIISRNAPADDF